MAAALPLTTSSLRFNMLAAHVGTVMELHR